jgi:hypothetical protein
LINAAIQPLDIDTMPHLSEDALRAL